MLADIKTITIVISHDHKDHKNLLDPLQAFLKEKQKTVNVCQTTNWSLQDNMQNSIGNTATYQDKYVADLQKLTNALGEKVAVIPILSNVKSTSRDIHDKCLALKIIDIKTGASILLPGDASGKLIKDMHIFCNNDIQKQDASFLKNIQVFLLSHHGSSNEYALDWFNAINDVSVVSTDNSVKLQLSQQTENGYLEKTQDSDLAIQAVVQQPQQYKLESSMNTPLLCIISSNANGADKIPTKDTVQQNVLLKYAPITNYVKQRQCFCCSHYVPAYDKDSDHIINIPAFSCTTGTMVPLFSTENMQRGTDGIYRIIIINTQNGFSIAMYNNSKLEDPLYQFMQSGGLDQEAENQKMKQEQQDAYSESLEELKKIWAKETLEHLSKARTICGQLHPSNNPELWNDLLKLNTSTIKDGQEEKYYLTRILLANNVLVKLQ